MCECGMCFLIHQLISFAKVHTPLRVTENHATTQLMHHSWRNLSGECSLSLIVHILSAQFKAWKKVSIQDLACRRERYSWWAQNTEQLRIVEQVKSNLRP